MIVQKQGKEEEEIQKKNNPSCSSETVSQSNGIKASMPNDVQAKMENSFGTSFSNVNIHQNDNSAVRMGALAFARGNNVHFAPGQYSPNTSKGQELLGHELSHVVQQRSGRVKPTTQGKGIPVNDSPCIGTRSGCNGQKSCGWKYGQYGW